MTMNSARVLVAAAALVACTIPRTSAGARVVVLDDGVKMGADGRLLSLVPLDRYLDANPAWDGRAVTLAGARGETVAFQIAVQAGAAPVQQADVRLSDLRREGGGVVTADRFTRFREWYVRVTLPSASPGGSAGPGEYPDALVPAGAPRLGLPVDVPAGRTQAIWLDCAIPGAAEPGIYRGTATVLARGEALARLDVVLRVHGFTLPRERHLRWRIGYSEWERVPRELGVAEGSAEWLKLEEDLYRLVWEEHRAVPTTHYHRLSLPTRGRGAGLAVDWTAFDRRFGRYLDGSAFSDRVPVNVFSLPLNLKEGWPVELGDDPARVDADTIAAAARLVGRHWDERGWRLADAFVYVADEPGPERFAAIARACDAVRAGDPRIRTSVAFYTEFGKDPRRIVSAMAGHVTMWDVAGDHLDPAPLRDRQRAGDTVGFYQGGEPFEGGEALDDDGLALTTWPWIAWRYGLDTLFLYEMTEWTYFRLDRTPKPWSGGKREIWENPLNQSWATNSQGVLLYPGPYAGVRGVVPSIRLKQVRRGMQDYEYLWLARQRGQGAAADAVARRLVPRALREAGPPGELGARGPWARDPRAWAAGREELAAAIARGEPATPPR
jgi:hypothetical protein